MEEIFKELSKKHSFYQLFNDFLELTTLSISISVDYRKRKNRGERFSEISKRYTDEEVKLFSNIYAELAVKLENPKDVLGELLMELQEGDKIKGQYLTPFHICKLNAALAFDEEKLKEDGYLYINEPSCGGGALVIALYEIMREKGYNPQQQLKVVARDLDIKSVYMCYVQFSLLGIPAKIEHSNTLSCETFDSFRTPYWVLGGWEYR
jgi:type I restriction-modification system DNA methylase subunit